MYLLDRIHFPAGTFVSLFTYLRFYLISTTSMAKRCVGSSLTETLLISAPFTVRFIKHNDGEDVSTSEVGMSWNSTGT